MNTSRLSMRVLSIEKRSCPDEMSVSKDDLGLRPRSRQLTSRRHCCLMLTSCSCPVEREEFAGPSVIPRVEDGLSEGEDKEPKRKPNTEDMASLKRTVSVRDHCRSHIICQNPCDWSFLAQKANLHSQIKKDKVLPKIDQTWQESLKKQKETDLESRVLKTLETSTLERTRSYNVNVEKQKREQCEEKSTKDLLQDLPFSFQSGSELPIGTVAHLSLLDFQKVSGHHLSDTRNMLKHRYKIKSLQASMKEIFLSSPRQSDHHVFLGGCTLKDRSQVDLRSKDLTVKKLMKNGELSSLDQTQLRKCKKYSKEGFLDLISCDSNVTNRIPLNRHDPFWPVGFGPLCSTPSHIINCPENEALWHKIEPGELSDSQAQNIPSRCKHLVFDSRTMSKLSIPHSIPEDWTPSLMFESRFESGNLHQAWRVGQYEYNLVLAMDTFTNRHTQWYYFRIQNIVSDVTYKFKIVNLLKKDSLYNYGMKPLVYSEKDAKEHNIGWFRSGHHITYKPWNNKGFNKSLPNVQYYCLAFQIEFNNRNDTYYLAHCYPYRYTDLKAHLDEIVNDSKHSAHFKKEVLCETRAGNSCFLLTITDYTDMENSKSKLGVVLTARVHPGETQASWMMKGILDFLLSEEPTAKELRKKCIFKIIPMLNPDGVIVGNYRMHPLHSRCSLSARDLNRNYWNPEQELFPTVWHTKKMVEELQKDYYILLYGDLHGHSRKPNAFMYGCSQTGNTCQFEILNYLRERIFPWLISQRDPERFDWKSCKFHIQKCKESTGRVVMYRQLGLIDSFTLEASFSGAIKEQLAERHFNIQDFMSIGKTFCEGIIDYISLDENPLKLNEAILNLTYSIATNHSGNNTATVSSELNLFEGEDKRHKHEKTTADNDSNLIQLDAVKGSCKINEYNEENLLKKQPRHQQAKNFLQLEDKMSLESIQQCCTLLSQINLPEAVLDSETSEDSDSEFESEVTLYSKTKPTKQKPSKVRSALPALSIRQMGKLKSKQINQRILKSYTPFVNQYANRSNGGIPMFAQERIVERTAKRLKEMEKAEKLQEQSNSHLLRKKEEFSHIPVKNQIFYVCTDHQCNKGLNRQTIGSKKEAVFSQHENNYRNIDGSDCLMFQ
ncbi:cytosolic carboxypeptidase 2-like isoform X2 [Chiloscyllium plagiosum]|uniref:cytosolic carboxypeptidase 2-like isoform X2 n=1 Tax=Chiloscyllium plagiosum TaxID=36176 RepID=UPI001CB869AA|nr:cytosolic carboxypeptidase 2-like isoform X2 [Chiloscyllium plagiosum]